MPNQQSNPALRVLLSTGNGRLHLVQAARCLVRSGVDLRVIQGWVPSRHLTGLVRCLGVLLGAPQLAYGMRQRVPADLSGRIVALPTAEFLTQFLQRASRYGGGLLSYARASCWGWRFFGWRTRFALHGVQIFHVRSGAGQGGAIRTAKRRGMKVLADHSIAHPAWMENHLRAAYERNGVRFDLGLSSPFWQLVHRDCVEADLVLVNSHFVKETFLQEGFPADKLRVVYLGVRPDFHGLRDWTANPPLRQGKPLRILFTGGFGFRKGAEFFLAALRILRQRGIPCEVTLVGSHAEAAPLLSQYKDLAPMMHLIGHVPQDELKGYLRAADLYLFPSLAEGCAQSGMEALAAGLCVVTTRESGLPIQDGETGYLVPVQDADAIAARIVWLAENPAALQRVGQKACAMMAGYTWEAYAQRVRCVYEELETLQARSEGGAHMSQSLCSPPCEHHV